MKANYSFFSTKKFWAKVFFALLVTFILALIAAYFLLSPRFNPALVNAILVHPNELIEHNVEMRSLSGVTPEEVTIPIDDARLNALFYKVEGSPDVILFNHGNAGNIDHRIEKIRAMVGFGISVLAYDYRGYGKSKGTPTVKTLIDDGLAAYDYLVKTKNYKPNQIVLYGESIGTGVSTEIARRRDYQSIVLESGFTSPERRGKEQVAMLNIYPSALLFDPDAALDNLDYVRGKHKPLLLVAGQHDDMIPCSHSKTMFAEATEPKQILICPNSGHNDLSQDWVLYKTTLDDFLKANAGAGKSKPDNSAVEQIKN